MSKKLKIYNLKFIIKKGKKRVINLSAGKKYLVRLTERGAEVMINCKIKAKEKEAVSVDCDVVHEAARTKAIICLKGVARDAARIKISGKVMVNKGAIKSEDLLEERLLLIGNTAGGEAEPVLEIEEDEVNIKHAASIGQVDDWQIFYLGTRGISMKSAVKLLMESFLDNGQRE